MMKQGAAVANTLGCVAFMYSGLGVIMQQIRGCDDELNKITSATLTGLIYKTPGGLLKCASGALAGFTISSLYCLYTSYDKIDQLRESLNFQQLSNSSQPSYKYDDDKEY